MKKRKMRAILVTLLVVIGIGYAAIRSGLNINGTTHVVGATWDVHFDNYQASNGSVTPTTAPVTSSTPKPTTVTYEVTLTNPGDFYEFTIDAVNNGSMDVMIESFSSKLGNTEITPQNLPGYLSYSATYSDGIALAANQQLLHNTTETLKIRVAYRDDIATSALPGTNQDLSFSFTITYVQADNNAIPVRIPPVYVVSDITMNIGSQIPNGVNKRSTPALALADWPSMTGIQNDTRPFYLKHELNNNNEITESYVVFVVTDAIAQETPGMVAGTYTLKGGDSGAAFAENMNTIKTAFDYDNNTSRCTFGSQDHISCLVTGLSIYATDNGYIDAYDFDYYCRIDPDGSSYCGQDTIQCIGC